MKINDIMFMEHVRIVGNTTDITQEIIIKNFAGTFNIKERLDKQIAFFDGRLK